MRDLQTADRINEERSDRDPSAEPHERRGTLLLKMHSTGRVRHLVVEVFVDVAGSVRVIMFEIVEVHHVRVEEATTVDALWLKVEAHIVPVQRLNLVIEAFHWRNVFEVLRDGQGQHLCLIERHLFLEVLVFASIVL